MSRQKTEINPIRADRVKILLKREKVSQTQLAERIYQTQQNLSRIMQHRQPLTEATAQLIVKAFPEYRLAWLMGYDDVMTVSEFKGQCVKQNDDVNAAVMTILDAAVREVCAREDMQIPTLDNIPEFLLLSAQLRDFADSLVWNYLAHRQHSHLWNLLDQAQ